MQVSRLVRSLAGGLFAEVVNKLVPLLILRYVVQKIGVEGFGVAQFSYWMIDVAISFVVFGYTTIAAVELGRNQADPKELARIIWEVIGLKALHAIVALVCLLAFVWNAPSYAEYRQVLTALSFVLVTTAIDMSFVHVGTSRMFSLSTMTIAVKLVSLAAILFYVNTPDDLLAFALLYFGANGCIALGNFLLNVRRFPFVRPSGAALKRRFRESLPYAITGILFMALDRYDVFVAEHFLGAAGSGLYGGPVRIAQALSNLISSLGMVFFSEVVATKDRSSLTRHVSLASWAFFALLLPIAAGALFTSDDLVTLVLGPGFQGSGRILTFLLFGLLGQSLVNVFGNSVLMFQERAKTINLILLLSTMIGVPLAYELQKTNGLAGIAAATASTRLFAGLFMTICARPFLDRLPIREFLTTAVPALLMYGVLWATPTLPLAGTILLGAAVYAMALAAFNAGKVRTLGSTLRSRLA